MRRIARLTSASALTAAGALALVGCSGSAGGAAPTLAADEQVSIVFESYNLAQAGLWGDTINGLIEQFEAEHPNIDVVGQPSESAAGGTAASVQQQLLAGSPPDVAQLTFDTLDYAVTELGALNLTEFVGQEGLDEAFGGEYPFHERARVLADWNGETYGMPYVFSTPVLWINETLLEEAGIDPATVDLSTWEDVLEVGKQVTAEAGTPSVSLCASVIGGNWCMQGVFQSNGGAVLSEDRTTIEFGSPEAIEVVDMMKEMYEAGVLSNEEASAQYEPVAQGKVALHLNTSALQGMFMAGAEANDWTLNATTMPAFGDQEVVPTNSGSALMIFSQDDKKKAAAWEFVQFMTSPTAYQEISTEIGYLPLRDSMTQEGGPLYEWVEDNPLVKPNLAQLDNLRPWLSYPGPSYQQVDTILGTAIEDSIYYGKDPAATMQEAADRAQELIEE